MLPLIAPPPALPISRALAIDAEVVMHVLAEFIKNEVRKVGFERVVMGLSGGIDSAVSCYLAVRALGPQNVQVIRMPYKSSSAASLADAQLIIEELNLAHETVEITGMVEAFTAVSPQVSAHRLGNVMARVRMITVYDRSMRDKALVLGTSNKTELLLGYGTIFGDLASAVNPIGDLYKTQVRQLARALGVPQPIIDKAPSADLLPDQTDESDFGFTYEQADALLYLLVDERYSPEEAVAAGQDPALVERIARMVRLSHYKRTLPVIPKLSGRSISHDFRYLRDSGS
ncbi:MAG: NAD+ synthase [Chloroflexi bacterium]|nr:NAD+ synthase [Chloroflexota bacterium]